MKWVAMMVRQSHNGLSMPSGYRQFFESARAKSNEHFIRVGFDVAKSRFDGNFPDAGRTEKELIRRFRQESTRASRKPTPPASHQSSRCVSMSNLIGALHGLRKPRLPSPEAVS